MKENEVLTMRGINKTFPGVKALNGVDFTLRKGEIRIMFYRAVLKSHWEARTKDASLDSFELDKWGR